MSCPYSSDAVPLALACVFVCGVFCLVAVTPLALLYLLLVLNE